MYRSLTRNQFRIFGYSVKNMATSRTIHIAPENTGLRNSLWQGTSSLEVSKKTTELLQRDLEVHHCFFNDKGFHNHISHHVLSLYGIGASAEQVQKAYDDNANYQRSPYEAHANEIKELKDFETARPKLGNEKYYTDFLVFFQEEIERKGWQTVVFESLFKGDERSEDLLVRMFSGFLHPLIQLMFGLEWQQPAIIAMALAQAAVHNDKMKPFLHGAEKAAKESTAPMPAIISLYEDVAKDEKLRVSALPTDTDRKEGLDGVIAHAFDEALRLAAKVNVKPEELEERTMEMYNAAIYHAAGAAIRAGKEPRFDFFMMHHVTVAPFLLTINAQSWIPRETKARLLEWKIRFDLVEYAARSCPEATLEKITSFVPKPEARVPKSEILSRIRALTDDGHVSKLLRSMGICEEASKPYEDKDWMMIKGDEVWTKLGQILLEAAEGEGPTWVRGAGLAEAWEVVPDRE
ncbi:HypA protein [Xylaria nigripes]|nr:HypA protein [Xylaria nigripes]